MHAEPTCIRNSGGSLSIWYMRLYTHFDSFCLTLCRNSFGLSACLCFKTCICPGQIYYNLLLCQAKHCALSRALCFDLSSCKICSLCSELCSVICKMQNWLSFQPVIV